MEFGKVFRQGNNTMPNTIRQTLLNIMMPVLIAFPISIIASAAHSADEFDAATISKDSVLASRLPKDIAAKGVLSIGSDTTYPPAEFLAGPDGQTPEGIDVDLAKAIAQKLGLKMEFLTVPFDSILPAIGPRYDLGVSAFTITNERYNAVDFVSYFNAGKQWAIQAGNPAKFNPDEPCGKTVGVQTASTGEKSVKMFNESCLSAKKTPLTSCRCPNRPI
jgi:polar amino acid transport system substrate-binding protein